jgi:hypothetical protein
VPAIVNGAGYALDPIAYIKWFSDRYGVVTAPRFPGFGLIVSIADPDLVRQVFTGDARTFHAGESSKPVLEPTVGSSSVLTLDEEPHMRQRKLLLEPFHGKNVQRWEATIRSITEQDIARWPSGKPFALHQHTRAITLEVILRAVFGVRERARFERGRTLVKEFANRAHPISMFPSARRDLGPLSPWVRFKRAREALDAFIYEEIERRRAQPDLAERVGGGALYRLTGTGEVELMLDGLTISNGLGWSVDGETMYLVDSGPGVVHAFAFDGERGTISHGRVLVTVADDVGAPDGMTVDAAGDLWVAIYGGGRVQRYSPDGELRETVLVPAAQSTSCAFAGRGLNWLYVTTATEDWSEEERRADPTAGLVYRLDTDAVGRPAAPFRPDPAWWAGVLGS